MLQQLKKDLQRKVSQKRAKVSASFFKTGNGYENLSAPGCVAPHDLAILALPNPGLTAHNAAYVAPRAAIGKELSRLS